ncbi:MAG: aminotransferase class IV [Ferruginibacter sp.]
MRYINFNGKILAAGTAIITAENRGLRYGDGLFETLKFATDKLVMMDEHMARLWKGMQEMKLKIPVHFTPDKLETQVHDLLKKNNFSYARIRISVNRGNGGLFDCEDKLHYIIECWPLTSKYTKLNDNGLDLCIFKHALKICDRFSNLKHSNFLPYVMGSLYSQEQKCNDAIIFNQYNRVCDSTIANIFIIANETVITPPLSEGCIAGTIRKFLLQILPELDYKVAQEIITQEMLMEAEEVFLTNSIYNMHWVAAIGQKKYNNHISRNIFEKISRTKPHIFC